jgi:hypothetical protein
MVPNTCKSMGLFEKILPKSVSIEDGKDQIHNQSQQMEDQPEIAESKHQVANDLQDQENPGACLRSLLKTDTGQTIINVRYQ